jgi:hypothetical protein
MKDRQETAQYVYTGFIGEKKPVEESPARDLEPTLAYTLGWL